MAMPPSDVEPSELFRKLLERPCPSEVVQFPGDSSLGSLRIRVLKMEEHGEAQAAAREYVRKKHKLTDDELRSPVGEALLGDATARELIALACMTAEPAKGGDPAKPIYGRIFRNAEDVNKLSADEVTALFGACLLVQKRFGPFEKNLSSDEEVNAWIERLKEGGSATPLSLLASSQLVELAGSLAERASFLSQVLSCQPESLPTLLESAPKTWVTGITSSIEPAASSTPSSEVHIPLEPITADDAMVIAQRMFKR